MILIRNMNASAGKSKIYLEGDANRLAGGTAGPPVGSVMERLLDRPRSRSRQFVQNGVDVPALIARDVPLPVYKDDHGNAPDLVTFGNLPVPV